MTDRLAASRTAPRLRLPLLPELALLLLGAAGFFLLPQDLALLTRILIMGLFVLSLSLVLGQAGIATLGHAALYGSGAYAAGLWALHVTPEPISGLLAGALAGAVMAFLSGALILRTRGLTLLMLSIAVAQVLLEAANKLRGITGGDDGLSGFDVAPVLGLFGFDFLGRTGYWYALLVLVLCYGLLRVLVRAPFGRTCRGIRSDRARMAAIGCNVYGSLLSVYSVSGAFAGIAGALSAQTSQVVSLHSLSFELSAEALVMLVIGGSGRLAGALIGTPVFMLVHHYASAINPYHWLFVIGVLLIVIVLLMPRGIVQVVEAASRRFGGSGRPHV